jgi:hypothetical protein
MSTKVVLEFDTPETMQKFLGLLCDGGIEDSIYESFSCHNINVSFDYSKAFTAWGWDGQGDPTVLITKNED